MKTTFDLPEPLLRRAKAAAALEGRSLRDLVAEALTAKLAADDVAAARPQAPDTSEWDAFKAKLVLQPDGSYINPDGIEDEGFFELLENIRSDRLMQQVPRDPFAELPAPAPKAAAGRKTRRG